MMMVWQNLKDNADYSLWLWSAIIINQLGKAWNSVKIWRYKLWAGNIQVIYSRLKRNLMLRPVKYEDRQQNVSEDHNAQWTIHGRDTV